MDLSWTHTSKRHLFTLELFLILGYPDLPACTCIVGMSAAGFGLLKPFRLVGQSSFKPFGYCL